jgi:imidazolonepropionase-like amidohydrolase
MVRPTARGKCGRSSASWHMTEWTTSRSSPAAPYRSRQLSPLATLEELQAAVDEASHFELLVEAHAHSAEGIKNAIRAGVASVEHASMIDDEGIALAKQRGTYLDMDIADDECI